VVNANGTTTTSASLLTACVVPVLILQGSMLMDRSVITMENVRLVTVRDLLYSVVVVLVQEGKGKAKAATHLLAMTQSALINVNVGPAQIQQGRIVTERSVITMENVRLVTVRDLLDSFVVVPVQERKRKAKAAIDGLAMTQSAYINAHAVPAQIGGGSMAMEGLVIKRENVNLILVDTGGKLQLVVLEGVDDDLRISRLLLAVGYSEVHVYYWN